METEDCLNCLSWPVVKVCEIHLIHGSSWPAGRQLPQDVPGFEAVAKGEKVPLEPWRCNEWNPTSTG